MMKHLAPVLAVVLCLSALISGCGSVLNPTPTTSTSFFTNAATTTPVFMPSSTSASSVRPLTSSWGSGNPLYSVYYSLREFLAARDEGKVDRSNLYKLLIDVDTVLSGSTSGALPITEKEITPPFSGLIKIICDKAQNDETNKKAIAMKETTEEVNAIITWIWSDSATQEEYGIASVQFNKTTKDIIVDMTYSVDYDLSNTITDYNTRCYVTGNASTNTFAFKYIVNNTVLVAKGISRGTDSYMLFKYKYASDPVNYIVVPGTADEDFFIAQNTSSSEIYSDPAALPSTVSSYKDWVVATDFFTAADLVTDISVLNSGNAKQGTIYIDF